ncbi:MAG: hypothetical protein ACP5OZ_03020 [Candidatus Woesearchaeota archaeon]
MIIIKKNNKKNKIGLEYSQIVSIIIILAVLIVISIIIYKFKIMYSENQEIEECKSSVEIAAASSYATKETFSTQLKCPTRYVTFKDEGVYVNNEKFKDYKGNQNIKSIVEDVVADETVLCWNKFHEGKLLLFNKDGIFCVVCSSIHFEMSNDVQLNNFVDVLKSKKKSGGISYFDYLTAYKTEKTESLKKDEEEVVNSLAYIDTKRSKDYAIVFTYIKGRDPWDNFLTKAKGAVPGIAMIAVGVVTTKFGFGPALIWKGLTLAGIGVGGVGMYAAKAEPQWISFVVFRDYKKEAFDELGCEELPAVQTQ